jgi:hypothetical protein
MPTWNQAKDAFDFTRGYYKLGEKSGNKRYDGHQYGWAYLNTTPEESLIAGNPKPMTPVQAQHRVAQRLIRNSNSVPRVSVGKGAVAQAMNVATINDVSPYDVGRLMAAQQNQAGNCGIMACVAIFYASSVGISINEMWSVQAYNHTTTGKWGTMNFGHAWAQLGTAGLPDCFIVDPWAGVVCKELEYVSALKSQLNKWEKQGKRIETQWSDSDHVWMTANHSSVLSLLEDGSYRIMRRADQTNSVRVDGRFPRSSSWPF